MIRRRHVYPVTGGLIGHVLTFLVMQRKALRTSSVAIFMSALAVADSLVLILNCLNNWFEYALKVDKNAYIHSIMLVETNHDIATFH